MIKKCLGCGAIIQNEDRTKNGYTQNLEHNYCERCFKINHYNAKINAELKFSNRDLIEKINQAKGFVIFLTDFLNLNTEVIETYQKIKGPKVLVLTKADIIPKNILKERLLTNIQKEYGIKENIFYFSVVTKENREKLLKLIFQYPKVLITGFTNSGKSSLLNNLFDTNITVSGNANTTLDFLKIKREKSIILDTPGFVGQHILTGYDFKKVIKPVTYQLGNKYYLKIGNFSLMSNVNNNFTIYVSQNCPIVKRKIKEDFPTTLKIEANQDLIIKGIGFINIKKACLIKLNISLDYLEVRNRIVGGKND